jgi:hypothetical protein
MFDAVIVTIELNPIVVETFDDAILKKFDHGVIVFAFDVFDDAKRKVVVNFPLEPIKFAGIEYERSVSAAPVVCVYAPAPVVTNVGELGITGTPPVY